jgi:hypothetical protein
LFFVELVTGLLDLFVPSNLRVLLVAKDFAALPNLQTEPIYGTNLSEFGAKSARLCCG